MSPEALDVLLGAPKPQTRADRLVAAVRKKKAEVEASVYQRDFHKFLTELVWTKDEARAGVVRQFPNHPYFLDLADDLLTESLLILDKSRRVLASWAVCAFDVWLLAGGQDPRWPTLMLSTQNRQVVLASRKLEDLQGSSWFLQNRVRFIVDELERRNVRERWPGFPTFEWSQTEGKASNGSRINAVPQGPHQMRGAGGTFIHGEECATWEQQQPSIEAAKLVTQGGGHFCIITTAQVGCYLADVVLDQLGERGWR
jgi:hypothetical protein